MRRLLSNVLLVLFWISVYLALDFAYSNVVLSAGPISRIPHPTYHHDLAPNFDGIASWGPHQYKLATNSLGFKDERVRDVELATKSRRTVLIGDSFTEGIGLPFEDTFSGMLFSAGRHASQPIEFLNAGVSSYSPTIYYAKIKSLLERGLKFDELVVFSDLTDVHDEATKYFCIDQDPAFRAYCPYSDTYFWTRLGAFLERNFGLSGNLVLFIKNKIRSASGALLAFAAEAPVTGAWPIVGNYQPLGVEGGIRRSLMNLEALSGLLRERRIGLTVVVYPHPAQLHAKDSNTRQAQMLREFCMRRCKSFIDLFPALVAEASRDPEWYSRLFIPGDIHYNREGNLVLFRQMAEPLLASNEN